MSSPEVGLVDVGDVELRVRRWPGREPHGVAFVLVHGLASNALTWERVAASLAERGHPVTSLDQRGHGRSGKPDGPYDLLTFVTDLDRLLSALDLHDVVLAGQSWGGNVVLEYAWRHPERLRGVVCVDGGTIDLQSRWPKWEDCQAALTPPPLAGTPIAAMERMLRQAHPSWDDEGIAATMANMEMRSDGKVRPWLTLERHLEILRGLWEHRPGQRYGGLQVPVLLVPADTGEASATAQKREEIKQAEALIPRVRVHWFTADHDVHVQYPTRLAEVMLDALEWFAADRRMDP